MSATGGSSSNSLETQKSITVEDKYKPIGLDQLSVSLLTDCTYESKLIALGYLCRREKTGSGGTSDSAEDLDDVFVLYWAVLRAKQLFLFHNEDSTRCKEVILLSRFVFQSDSAEGPPNWPKGFKSATLNSAGPNSVGSQEARQHHLGWWPKQYQWQPHIRDQVAKAREDPISAQAEYRQLLIAAKRLLQARSAATSAAVDAATAEFEEPQLPVKAPKQGILESLKGRFRSYSNTSTGSRGGGFAVEPTSQQPAQARQDNDEEQEEEELYSTLDDTSTDEADGSAETTGTSATDKEETYEVPNEPPARAVPAKPPKPLKVKVTPQILSSQQLKPIPTPAPRGRSDDSDSSGAGGGGPSQRKPSLSPTPMPRGPPATGRGDADSGRSLFEQLVSGDAVDASVSYFNQAFDCNPQLQDVVSELEAAPVGCFVVHGGSCGRGGHIRLLTLLVKSADSRLTHAVCRYIIKEAAGGAVQIAGTLGSATYDSISQLLYHYHIHDLPMCKGQPETPVRLVRPLHLTGRASFLSASVWCLGDKPLCLSLLAGVPVGTFALLIDPQSKHLSLYATNSSKQAVKMRINMEDQKLQQRQHKFWVSDSEKFDSLEQFLLHYHLHVMSLIGADSAGKQAPLRLATPCQLSEKFQANLQQYLADHVTEEFTEGGAEDSGGSILVSVRRFKGASVRTVTQLDGGKVEPMLTAAAGRQPVGVTVDEARVRGIQWIYRITARPDVQFDSLDKLLMYASQYPEKLPIGLH